MHLTIPDTQSGVYVHVDRSHKELMKVVKALKHTLKEQQVVYRVTRRAQSIDPAFMTQ